MGMKNHLAGLGSSVASCGQVMTEFRIIGTVSQHDHCPMQRDGSLLNGRVKNRRARTARRDRQEGMRPMMRQLALAAALGIAAALPAGTALAANIDTTAAVGVGNVYPFGVGLNATPTYGQTFTADPTQTNLTGFSLFLDLRRDNAPSPVDNDGPLNLRGYLATWDGSKAGTILYTGDMRTKPNTDHLTEFAFGTNQSLVAGQRYVAFLSVLDELQAPGVTSSAFRAPLPATSSVLDGGDFVYNNTTSFNNLFIGGWSTAGGVDQFFRASFANGTGTQVSEPASLALLGAGLFGLARRRRGSRTG